MEEKIKELYDSDTPKSYKLLLELEEITIESNELYDYFNLLLEMLSSDKSYVRVRGFRLICSLAVWDKDNKIDNNIDIILKELEDDKPTAVRQCLSKLNLILLYKVELNDIIEQKLRSIDLSKYKDSMEPLIRKDIDNLLKSL